MIWIGTETAARFLGISDRAIRKNAENGVYQTRWTEGRQGGGVSAKVLEIYSGSLPPEVQIEIYAKLLPPSREEAIDPPHLILLDSLTQEARLEAGERFTAWTTWKRYCQAQASTNRTKREITDEFAELWGKAGRKPGVSIQTLYRWDKAIRDFGPGGLTDNRGGHNRGKTAIPDEASSYFCKLYLDQNKRTLNLCYMLTQEAARQFGWEIPSYSAFKRKAQDLDKQVLVLGREGNKAFDDKCMIYSQRSVVDLAGNGLWVSDHHRLDVHCTYQNRVIRPWITGLEDIRSRRIVGLIVSPGPNQNTIRAAFAQAAVKYGVPDGVYLDNGKDYKAAALFSTSPEHGHSLAQRLSLKVIHAIPYNAKAKPIERVFRTFKMQFSVLWQSYCGGKPDEKPERLKEVLRNARPDQLPTFEQLAAMIVDWAEYWYNENPHRGEGMDGKCPRQVHEETTLKKRVMPEDVARLMFMRTEKPRKIRREGIWMFDRWYHSEKLYELQDHEVYVSYNTDQIGRIYVWDLEGRYLCEASNRTMLDYNVSEEDMRAAAREKQRLKRLAKERLDAYTAGAPDFDPAAAIASRRQAIEAERAQAPAAGPRIVEPIRNPNLEEAARQIRAEQEAAVALEAVGGTAGAFGEWRRANRGSHSRRSSGGQADSGALRDALQSIKSTKSNGGVSK